MRNKESRFELNKKIRRILVRHGIDSQQLSFSGYQSFINFSGMLLKNNGNNLSSMEVINLIKELNGLGKTLQFMLTNWYISPNSISFHEGSSSEDLHLLE